jgi:hypothetical protein
LFLFSHNSAFVSALIIKEFLFLCGQVRFHLAQWIEENYIPGVKLNPEDVGSQAGGRLACNLPIPVSTGRQACNLPFSTGRQACNLSVSIGQNPNNLRCKFLSFVDF